VGSEAHREVAREVATRSLTLLENDGVLPLSPDLDHLAVCGPNADALVHQLGGWSNPDYPRAAGTTVLDGLREALDGTRVTHERGVTVAGEGDVEPAREAAAGADAAVVVLGESHYWHDFGPADVVGPTDEFPRRTAFRLPAGQRDLARAVHATGTPTVVVLVSGRPLAIPWLARTVPGLLFAYYPGSEGGRAVADVLLGERDPSGRLPVSIPRSAAHLPTRFNHLRSGRVAGLESEEDEYDPLYPFGHGLSYTSFAYEDLSLSARTVRPGATVEARVTVRNVGDRAGREAVHAYVTDEFASRVRPVRELAAFESVALDPGEEVRTSLPVEVPSLATPGRDGDRRVEAGEYRLDVGGLDATFTVDRRY
jgi:beta-glucosidase